MNHLPARFACALALFALAACSKSEATAQPGQPASTGAASTDDTATTAITADDTGFHPSSVTLAKGKPARLVFTRTTDDTCARQVVFPELSITKDLPLNQQVAIDIPTSDARKLTFQCGMGMYKSSVVVN